MKRILSMFLSCMIGMSWVIAQTEETKDPLLVLDEESIVTETDSQMTWMEKDTYVTTASKKKELVQEAPANITVVTYNQIKELGANSLAEVLSFVPGITVIETYFGLTNVVFRGTYQELYNNKSLMLINGHATWEVANGSYNLEYIPLEAIKQIEIIRGPGSVLYGTNAYAGVINIITFDGTEEGINKVSAKGGSFNTQEYSLSGGAKKGDFNFFAAASVYKTDGYEFNVKRDELGQRGTFDYADEYQNAFVNLQYKEITLNYNYYNQDKEKFGFLPILASHGQQHFENYYFDLKWVHGFSDELSMQVNTRYDRMRKDYDLVKAGGNGYVSVPNDTSKHGCEVQINYVPVESFSVAMGGSWDEYYPHTNWENNTRVFRSNVGTFMAIYAREINEETAAYTNFNWKMLEKLDFVGGLRYSYHTTAGKNTAPNAGLIYEVGSNKYIKFLYGEAFRVPNIYETDLTMYGVINSNPNLDSETIKTYDLGLDMLFADRFNFKTNLFFLSTYDTIVRADSNGDRVPEYVNGEGQEVWGIEVDLKMDMTSSFNMFVNCAFNDGEMKDSGLDVAFLPEVTGNAGISWKMADPFTLGMNVQYVGEREDNNRDYTAEDYTLFNMQGIYRINDSFKLTVNATNLFDEEYYYPEVSRQNIGDMGNGPGQAFYGKVEYTY